MLRVQNLTIMSAIVLLVSGCGNPAKILVPSNSAKVLTFDGSKQVALGFETTSFSKTDDTIIEKKVFYCLGKSPEIVKNKAKEAKLIGEILKKGSLTLSGASSEGSASVAFRTQTLELLRDQSLMNCISYGAGGLSKFGFEALNRKVYNVIPLLAAIDGLTGSITSAPVSLVSSSNVGSAEQLAKVSTLIVDETKEVNKIKDTINNLSKEIETLKENLDTKHDPADIKSIMNKKVEKREKTEIIKYSEYLADKKPYDVKLKELSRLNEILTLREETLNDIKESRKSIKATGATSTSSNFGTFLNTRVSDETIKEVSGDIVRMLRSYYQLGSLSDTCAMIVVEKGNEVPAEGSMLSLCISKYNNGMKAR